MERYFDPLFCSSTVVNGNGFLWLGVWVNSQLQRYNATQYCSREHLPFWSWFWFHLGDSDFWRGVFQTWLVYNEAHQLIKHLHTLPVKGGFFSILSMLQLQFPEFLGCKSFHFSILIHYESKRRELARTFSNREGNIHSRELFRMLVCNTSHHVYLDLEFDTNRN